MVYAPQPDLVCKLIVQPGMACAHLVYCGNSSSVINQELNMFPEIVFEKDFKARKTASISK